METDALRVRANFIFTRDLFITLSVFPADCPSAVIYAREKQKEDGIAGRPLVGIAHWGRRELSKMDPYFAIQRLIDEGIDSSSIRVTLCLVLGKITIL